MSHIKLDIYISPKTQGTSPKKGKKNGESGESGDEFQKSVSEQDMVLKLTYSLQL